MMITDSSAQFSDSFCGYASAEWTQLGDENRAVYKRGNLDVAFCSKAYYSKSIAVGFILPIIPFGGYEYFSKRWVKVTNSNTVYSLEIEDHLQICKQRYPYELCGLNENLDGRALVLGPGESAWLAIPEVAEYELKVRCNDSSHVFRLKEKRSYSWWMISV